MAGGFSLLAAAVGFLGGFLVLVYPALSMTGESLLGVAAIALGGAIALGIKLSVVTIAGASLAHFRQ